MTHLVGPLSWRLRGESAHDPRTLHTANKEGDPSYTVDGLPTYETIEELDSLLVLSLPAAIRVEQRLFANDVFYVSVQQIDDDRLAMLREEGVEDVEGIGRRRTIE